MAVEPKVYVGGTISPTITVHTHDLGYTWRLRNALVEDGTFMVHYVCLDPEGLSAGGPIVLKSGELGTRQGEIILQAKDLAPYPEIGNLLREGIQMFREKTDAIAIGMHNYLLEG